MQLTGITRSTVFSPFQHAENDRLILEGVARSLRRRGCRITLLSEEQVGREPIRTPAVFSMCQGARATAVLDGLERDGHLIINSPSAVRNCYREVLYRKLDPDCTLMPPTVLMETSAWPLPLLDEGPVWIKRGDVHATQQGDVTRVDTEAQAWAVLQDFRQRDIRNAAVQRHVDGEVVKFYGVVGTGFFRHYIEKDHKVSPVGFSAARPAIEQLVQRMGLEVYGGDAVMDRNGQVLVIDINDWPSFAYFRDEAAEAIASRIFQLAGHQRGRVARVGQSAHTGSNRV